MGMGKKLNLAALLFCTALLLWNGGLSGASDRAGNEQAVSPGKEMWHIASLNWEPYSGAEMSTQGNLVQRLRTLLEQRGVRLVVEFYPWARAQEFAKEPGFVGYFPAWPEEVQPGFIASDPLGWSDVSVMTYAGSGVEWQGLEKLFQEEYIGLIRTYDYPENVARLAKKYPQNVTLLPSETSLLKKLARGHISAAITDSAVMQYLAERMALGNLSQLARLENKPLVLAFQDTPRNRQRRDMLNALIQASGLLDSRPQ